MAQTQENAEKQSPYLAGKLLIAMPGMDDRRFEKTVIYLCVHNADGAMGLVLNRTLDEVSFDGLLEQMKIEVAHPSENIAVHFGGPVESERGFVLHSPDYMRDSTMVVDSAVAMTATLDVLRAIAEGHGPKNKVFAVGYTGWGPGQLDRELLDNGWMAVDADTTLVFGDDQDTKWERAFAKIGVDVRMLSEYAGHA
ncbi:YqgE/AlgH family protein [Varunaivibrio sulfuroxidans]|uniref:UPF0301 protein EDD55_105203 n=1 Tax=Varunaivibrio sulfuroxidans TaxID=1773489 RepID=A0A4R3JBH9_9PROT|nr:YqgE/AlgH family protein [Varunaivibrio sulfuroxidans]TCS62655.1 putative transcriptional regulator [Varunaivibrio sulfuroxidans]WES30679.1 YqgE/AlgH family protein [Varunaivibrio sulfuroxidans]